MTNIEMVQIPSGTFLMGSPDSEPERTDKEGPQHQVTVPQFFMGRYPITQAQYRSVMSINPSWFKGKHRPVENVSWYDAVEFCQRLSHQTGKTYRLPTEAEWEYACRAGTTTPFYFGETITTNQANYNGNYTYGDGHRYSKGEYRESTTQVNHFGIGNAFGLIDMHGNVCNWCQDVWHDSYEGAPTDGSAWIEEGTSFDRVTRGGCWISHPKLCRSASRHLYPRRGRCNIIGFRVVCT